MNDNPLINKNIVASSLLWKFLERIVSQGCNLIVQILLARLLMPEEFGNLAIIMAIINYLSMFIQAGLTTAIVQKKTLDQLDVDTLFTITFILNIVLYSCIFFVSPYIASYYDNLDLVMPIRVTALILFLYSINSIQIGILSRGMNFRVLFYRSIVAVPIAGVISIMMAYMRCGLWSLIVNSLLCVLLSTIIMAIGTRSPMNFRLSLQRAKNIYSFAIKIIGANIVSGFSDLFRTMSIGRKYSISDLAYYDKAFSYSYLIVQIASNSIQSVVLPAFSRNQDNKNKIKEMSRSSIRLSMFIMTPILFGAIIISKTAVLVLLTERWLPCVPYLMLFCLFRWSGCVVGIDKQVFLALGRSSLLLYFEFLSMTANIIMLFITIPIGIKVVAIGAFIVESSANIGLMILSTKIYDYSLYERFKDLFSPIIYSCFMMFAMWLIQFLEFNDIVQLIIQIIVGLGVYICISILLRDKSMNEIVAITKNKLSYRTKPV